MGLNVEIVREHILSICSNPAAFGAVCVRSAGMRFEIVNGAVVTVVKDHAMPSHLTIECNRRQHPCRSLTRGISMIDTQMQSGIDHQIVLLPKFILSAPNDCEGVPRAARFVADSGDHPV
jgi:hypothetical protein